MLTRHLPSAARVGRWCGLPLLAVVALLPWWRNHAYLRSFYDYGVVIGGAGRIAAGQRPYTDFVTPTQTGWYGFNLLAEKMGGGTFQAMTFGGAACTLVALAVLVWMLTRVWPLAPSLVVTGALVCATTAQHTLFWYNSWGVVLLAVVAWAGAAAPVLSRGRLAWHLLAGAGLFLGGVNKINMQLMALALAWGWALRAGLKGESAWSRVGATLLFYAGCCVLPVLAEMAWTGASFAVWWHNVIALPVADRSGMVLASLAPRYLFVPLHDFYRPLLLPQVGLCGVVLTLLTVAAILRHHSRPGGLVDKILAPVCGLVAAAGGMVLLATNIDIAYIGLAGWLALLVALWIGFGLPAKGAWFYGALVLPAGVIGAIAWQSAWVGQRSQFGHSAAPRAAYVPAEQAGPDFAYLRGTRMPPEFVESLRTMAAWRQSLTGDRRRHVYFGPGTEWAAHIWPVMSTPGLPIYLQKGNSFGAAEQGRLYDALRNGTIWEMTVSHVLDMWEGLERILLEHRYDRHDLGPVFSDYSLAAAPGVSLSPVWFTRVFGGNVDSRHLESDGQLLPWADWRIFLGVTSGRGWMQWTVPTQRLQGEAVLRRLPGADPLPVTAQFAIYAQVDAATRSERWEKAVELPAGQDEIVVPYAIDGSRLPVTFTVELPEKPAGVAAGWRALHLSRTVDEGPAEPAWFYRGETSVVRLDEAALARLLPGAWRPERAVLRGGRVTAEGIELSPGGELWMRVRGIVSEFSGTAAAVNTSGPLPHVRGIWYRGGRLEVYTDMLARESDRTADFNAWCAEPGGWLVIAVDPATATSAVRLRVLRVTQAE